VTSSARIEGGATSATNYVDSAATSRSARCTQCHPQSEVTSSASAECSGNTCTAEARASASACSTTAPDCPTHRSHRLLIVLGAIGAVIARRTRRGGVKPARGVQRNMNQTQATEKKSKKIQAVTRSSTRAA